MATSPKQAQNAQHVAFPSLFKRTGEARRIKGFRASRETFNRAMRMAKVLENAPRLMVMTPIGAMVLSESATALIKEDGAIAALLLNGFELFAARDIDLDNSIDTFLAERNMIKMETLSMFENGEDE